MTTTNKPAPKSAPRKAIVMPSAVKPTSPEAQHVGLGSAESVRPLTVIVPSRGRPGSVARQLAAWTHTRAFEHARLLYAVSLDEIDVYRHTVLAALQELVDEEQHPPMAGVVSTGSTLVRALNSTALLLTGQMIDQWAGSRHIGFMGDDHLPRTAGWAGRYVSELDALVAERGVGMVYGDDGLRGERLCTEWAVSASWVTALGRMVPALVTHMFCDNAMLDLGRAAQCVRYLGSGSDPVRIEHMHPLAKGADGQPKSQMDDTYRASQGTFEDDRRIYIRWSTRPPSADKTGLVRQAQTLQALKP